MKIDESNYISELKRKNSKALEYTYSKYVGLVYKGVFDLLKNTASRQDIERQIFFNRYILNKNINNIAEYLKLPRTVVDNRLSRGRKLIKNKWEKLMGR